MLYPTLLCNPSFSSSKFLPPLFLSPPPPLQGEKQMECVVKVKTETEEVCGGAVSVSGEDFFVDQLLNLDDHDGAAADGDVKEENAAATVVVVKDETLEEEEKEGFPATTPPPTQLETDRQKDVFGSVLSVPAEEADLEWLSQFVEESFSTFSTPFPSGFGHTPDKPRSEPGPEVRKARAFSPPSPAAVLSKARRSKRARTGCRVWSSSMSETAAPPSPGEQEPAPARGKKQRREGGGGGLPVRRCSHCGVQKTPQWRAGPMGAKTLCNACGVRYKSGRLLPEYRPACSPTFSSELHSNSHRKVLEMRRKKEMTGQGGPESRPALAQPVPSFG